jgi:WhiB family transcriptional regulator, redox-sensing transcriptional regulator
MPVLPVCTSMTSRLAEHWQWRLSARCRGEDPSLFFHPEAERGAARKARQRKAKAICADCPVTAECRLHSLRFPETFGIWGGMSEEERDRFLAAPRDRNGHQRRRHPHAT